MKRTVFPILLLLLTAFLLFSCQKSEPEAMKSVTLSMAPSIEYGKTPILHLSSTRPGQELTLSVDIDGKFSYCKDEPITMPEDGEKAFPLGRFDFTPGLHFIHAETTGCACGRKAVGDFSVMVLDNRMTISE